MDDIKLQFTILLQQIRSEINQALIELQACDPGYEEYSPGNDSSPENKNLDVFAAIKSLQKSGYANDAKKFALDHRRYRLEWKLFRISRYTAVVLLFYTAITGLIAYYSFKSVDAARESLVRSQRPWLGKDGPPELTMEIVNTDMVSGNLIIPVRNYGPSPALDVGTSAVPFIRTKGDMSEFKEAREKACRWAETAVVVSGDYIFPQNVKKLDAIVLSRVEGIEKRDRFLIAACIAYRDQFDMTHTTHHTTFCVMGAIKDTTSLYSCGIQEIAD